MWSLCLSPSGNLKKICKSWPMFHVIDYFREGINIFLDGFVPTENLRFREDALVFKVSENATEEDVKRMTR